MPRLPHKVTVIATTGAGKGLPRQAHFVFGKTNQHLLEKVFQELGKSSKNAFMMAPKSQLARVTRNSLSKSTVMLLTCGSFSIMPSSLVLVGATTHIP